MLETVWTCVCCFRGQFQVRMLTTRHTEMNRAQSGQCKATTLARQLCMPSSSQVRSKALSQLLHTWSFHQKEQRSIWKYRKVPVIYGKKVVVTLLCGHSDTRLKWRTRAENMMRTCVHELNQDSRSGMSSLCVGKLKRKRRRRRRRYSPCSRSCAGFAWDQVVELSVLLEMHEKEEEGTDGEGQIEVEGEKGELKERRTWMTMRMIWDSRTLEPWDACDPTLKVWQDARLRSCSDVVHFARVHVHVIVLVVDVVCLILVLSARVVVHAVFVQFP